jgi:hypothetical protein
VVVRAKITVAARVFRAVLLLAQGQTETQALVAQQEQVVELAAALRRWGLWRCCCFLVKARYVRTYFTS